MQKQKLLTISAYCFGISCLVLLCSLHFSTKEPILSGSKGFASGVS